MKSKANKQTMPQAKEKLQRLKAVSTYLQSPEIRSSSSSSCVDTSKQQQQQQPATKLCQSTKCKTENTVLRVLFSHLKITQKSDLEPPHAIEEKNRSTKFTHNCQETPQEHKDFWSFTKTAVVQAGDDSTRETRCCGSNEDGTWDGTGDGTRDRTGPSKSGAGRTFWGGVF
jgi:hypothetical protein